MKPLIGITSNYSDDPKFMAKNGVGAEKQDFSYVAIDYTETLYKAGAIPVIIPFSENLEMIEEIFNKLDGIILSGGNDIDTYLFNERASSKLGKIIPKRDELEIMLAKKAIEKNKPVLGICRGVQILNVALGGNLIQDIASESKEYLSHDILTNERHRPAHPIEIEKDSILFEVYQTTKADVNSYHHQAVKQIADDLKPIAYSDDGICEAVEYKNKDRYVLGVQWHPEMMASEDEKSLKLIENFVENVNKRIYENSKN